MADMDAAILYALWRHTAQIKYAKPNYEGFLRIILQQIFYNLLILVIRNHFPQIKPTL